VEPTADPGALDAAARALRQQASVLEGGGLAATFNRQAEGSRWTGRAATQFRNTVKDDTTAARALAGELRAIATMIEAGATKIRKYRADQAKKAQQAAANAAPNKPLAAYPH